MIEFQGMVGEQNRRREEAIMAVEAAHRERERLAEFDQSKLEAKIMDVSEEMNRKLLQRELKIRDENDAKYSQIEKVPLIFIASFYHHFGRKSHF